MNAANRNALVAAARAFAAAAKAEVTRRAYPTAAAYRTYLADRTAFRAWCVERGAEPIPAAPGAVAAFLTSQARAGAKADTLARRIAAIHHAHRMAGHDDMPTGSDDLDAMRRLVRALKGQSLKPRHEMPTAPKEVDALRRLAQALKGQRLKLR